MKEQNSQGTPPLSRLRERSSLKAPISPGPEVDLANLLGLNRGRGHRANNKGRGEGIIKERVRNVGEKSQASREQVRNL